MGSFVEIAILVWFMPQSQKAQNFYSCFTKKDWATQSSILQGTCSFTLAQMNINIIRVIFYIPKVIKNTTTSFQPQLIKLKAYNKDKSICPLHTVVDYIKATEKYRKSEKIIISYHKLSIVTTQTVSRYVKQTLKAAGINTSLFTAHSTKRHLWKCCPWQIMWKKGGENQYQPLENFLI